MPVACARTLQSVCWLQCHAYIWASQPTLINSVTQGMHMFTLFCKSAEGLFEEVNGTHRQEISPPDPSSLKVTAGTSYEAPTSMPCTQRRDAASTNFAFSQDDVKTEVCEETLVGGHARRAGQPCQPRCGGQLLIGQLPGCWKPMNASRWGRRMTRLARGFTVS